VSSDSFLYVADDTIDRVVGARHGALILAKDECGGCADYESEIRRLMEDGRLGDLVVGKMVLTQPGARGFKRANPWLSEVDFLPYTLLYTSGEKVDEFAASKGNYLLERALDAGFL
jgi:hypothetical protein